MTPILEVWQSQCTQVSPGSNSECKSPTSEILGLSQKFTLIFGSGIAFTEPAFKMARQERVIEKQKTHSFEIFRAS